MSKVVVIGGTSGIGKSFVETYHSSYSIQTISRSENSVKFVEHSVCDVLENTLPQIDDPIQGIVYLPGSIALKPFKSLKTEHFISDFQINVIGAVNVLKAYESNLKAYDGVSSVVLFSTVAVQKGMAFHASIASAKGAIEGLTRSLAAEWSPQVRVNCIAPSIVDTPLASRLLRTDKQREASAARHPLQRIGTAYEMAHTIDFLLSDKSSWMTGQVISVDGGMSAIQKI